MSSSPAAPVLNVFVSSTYMDMRDEREVAKNAIDRVKHLKFSGMEFFANDPDSPLGLSLQRLAQCQVYVGIFGDRYGSGITEKEYKAARELKMPIFVFIKETATPSEAAGAESARIRDRLERLKERLRKAHTCKPFRTTVELEEQVYAALSGWVVYDYLIPKLERGWRQVVVNRARMSQELRAVLQSVQAPEEFGDKYAPLLRAGGLEVASERYKLCKPVRNFVGREREIEELSKCILEGENVCLWGRPGAGKTQLVWKVAEAVSADFYDGQLVVSMCDESRRPRPTDEVLEECIRAFNGPLERRPGDLPELLEQLRLIQKKNHALFVLDNAASADQVEPLRPPAGGNCSLLIITDKALTLPHTRTVRVDGLKEADALRMLTSFDGCERLDDQIAADICTSCGCLPAAIRLAGCTLGAMPELSPAEYARRLRAQLEHDERDTTPGVSSEFQAALRLSYSLLKEGPQRVLRSLAVFPRTFTAEAAEFVCRDKGDARLSELVRRGLVMEDEETHRYFLRTAVRLFAGHQTGTPAERAKAAKRFATFYRDVLVRAEGLYLECGSKQTQGTKLFDLEWKNIRTAFEWAAGAAAADESDVGEAELCLSFPHAGSYLFDLRLSPRERIRWLDAAMECARRLGREDAECRLEGMLGRAHLRRGDRPAALEHFERQAELAARLGDLHSQGLAFSCMGECHMREDDKAAHEFFRKAIEIFRDDDPRELCRVLDVRGQHYLQGGEFEKAQECFKMQFSVAEGMKDPLGKFKAQNNLATVCINRGKYREAWKMLEELLIFDESVSHVDYARTLNSCGHVHLVCGNTRKAISCFKRAYTILKDQGSPAEENITLSNLAAAYADHGEVDKAVKTHRRVIEALEEAGKTNDLAQAHNDLGKTYFIGGEFGRALEHYDRALALVRENELSRDRLGEAVLLSNRGEALARLGHPDDGLPEIERALEYFNASGVLHYQSHANNNLGVARFVRGEYGVAEQRFKDAIDIARDIGHLRGEAVALYNRGLALYLLGDPPHAITHAEAALEIFQSIRHRQTDEVRRRVREWNGQVAA